MIIWLSHAFWYTLAAMFAVSLAWALLRMVWVIVLSIVLIALNLPAASRHWLRQLRAH